MTEITIPVAVFLSGILLLTGAILGVAYRLFKIREGDLDAIYERLNQAATKEDWKELTDSIKELTDELQQTRIELARLEEREKQRTRTAG